MTTDLDRHVTRATTAGIVRAYKLGAVPDSPAYPYAVLSLDTGRARGRTADLDSGKLYELAVQFFGRTDDSVRDLATLADAAFNGAALVDLEGAPVAERDINTRPYRDPDDQGVLSVLHIYRY